MALRVWLPLDGNLTLQGCSNIIATANGTTVNTSGKIGSCYSFNGSSSYISLNSTPFSNTTNEFSYTCWAKFNSTASYCLFSDRIAVDSRGISLFVNNNGNILFDIGNERRSKAYTFSTGIWYHIAFTYKKGSSKKIYINGIEIDSINSTGTMTGVSTSNAFIGASQNANATVNANYLNGFLNDVRIYDHCLSAAEVHEISLGLILHYKLDSQEIKLGTNLVTGITKGGLTTLLTDGRLGVETSGTNADTYFTVNLSENITNGTKYYLCCDASGISPEATWNFPLGTQSNSSLLFAIHNGHNELSFTANDINWGTNRLFLDDNGRPDWANKALFYNFLLVKIESGTEIIVKDSSGYNHNGTVMGDIQIMNNSARYNNCIYNTNGGVNYIQTPTLNMPTDAITLNIWFKTTSNTPTSDYHMVVDSVGNSSGRLHYEMAIYKTGYFRGGLYVNGTRYANNCTSTTGCNGNWHMLTLTYDGTTIKRYFDKNMEKSTSVTISSGLLPTATLRLFKDGYSSYACINASISDFRIYCTALSAEDIKALYEVGAKVDNKGNLHTYEFNEFGSNQLTKTGIFYNYAIEPYIQLADGSYWKLMLFHYVDSGKNLFTSSNATYNDGFGLYSRLRDIDNFKYNDKYEFYVILDGIEYRWTQTSLPTASSIAGKTVVSGYTDPVNGLAKASLSNTYIGYNSWWGACGSWTSYTSGGKTGIPGFGAHSAAGICTEYLALYTRIDQITYRQAQNSHYANNLIEF